MAELTDDIDDPSEDDTAEDEEDEADEADEPDEPEAAAEEPARPAGIRWDVLEEHLDEAAYAITRFRRALESPHLTLHDVSRYPEEGLIAHVDALVIGDAVVREHLLLPALVEANPDDPDRITAAALALMESARFDDLEPFLGHELPEVREAVARAGHFAHHAGLDPWLTERAQGSLSDALRAGLLTLGAARQLLVHPVLDALQSDDTGLVLAAARAALYGEPQRYLPLMDYLLEHASMPVREAAMLAGLTWGSSQAWWQAKRWALDPAQPSALATLLFALLGSHDDQQALAALASEPKVRTHILFALGFSGDVSLAPLLFEALASEQPLEARLAAQALGITFGFMPGDDAFSLPPAPPKESDEPLPPPEEDPEAEESLPPLSDEELEADLVPLPEEELPAPNVEGIRAFCRARSGLPDDRRVLYGQPYGAAHVIAVLGACPLRWRHPLALGLFVRTGGASLLDTRARTRKQRADLSGMPARSITRFLTW